MKGFTLVELVIVIAIVIVLSVVSVPIYRNYVDKAKYTEMYALIGTVASAQKAYYSEFGQFYYENRDTNYNSVLGVDARGNKYFTSFSLGCGYVVLDHYFDLRINLPTEFTNGGATTKIFFQYNITQGSTIRENSLWSSFIN